MHADPITPILYLRFRKRVAITKGEPVRLGQIARLLTEPKLEETLSRLIMIHPEEEDGNLILIDMMQVIAKVRGIVPNIQVECFGDPHALVEVQSAGRKTPLFLIVMVWLLLFIGSGLAIMNFHEDVSMPEVHVRIYELLTGKRPAHPYLLQIPYSFGLGVGMVLFFNHLFKRKFNEEPSPLEVEMYLYQQNMNEVVIAEEYAKIKGSQPGGGARTNGEGGG